MKDGLRNSSNNLITNLTGRIISDAEVEILKYGQHGIATRPCEFEIMVIAENFLGSNRT